MLLEVGRITKPHGVRGEVLVRLTSDRTERLAAGAVLFTDDGPLTVVSSSAHHDRWIVRFEEIPDRDAAEGRRGTVLRAQPLTADDLDAGTFWVHDLVGATVELPDGTSVGTVEAVEANPASDLLVLSGGALVPVVFITDQQQGRVVIDPPEGLFDL
jgi:16S rRNA processing protein RimM